MTPTPEPTEDPKDFSEMSLEELREERSFWEQRIQDTSGHCALRAAADFSNLCALWIRRREQETPQ